MKQGTKQTVAVRAAPPRRKAYIEWGVAWFGKGRTMVLRFTFKILGLITIFLISNRNLNRWTLIHYSTVAICKHARTHTQTQTHTTSAGADSIIRTIHVDKVFHVQPCFAKITAQIGID